MFGFICKKRAGKPALKSLTEDIWETDHDGANVRDTILASNVS